MSIVSITYTCRRTGHIFFFSSFSFSHFFHVMEEMGGFIMLGSLFVLVWSILSKLHSFTFRWQITLYFYCNIWLGFLLSYWLFIQQWMVMRSIMIWEEQVRIIENVLIFYQVYRMSGGKTWAGIDNRNIEGNGLADETWPSLM